VLRYPPERTSYARHHTLETLIKVLAVCRVIIYLGPEQEHIRDTRSNQGGLRLKVEAPREDQIPTDTDRPRQNRCPLLGFATHLCERGDHVSSPAAHAVVMEARQCTSHPRCSRPISDAPPSAF
jgi:hypothetical protein